MPELRQQFQETLEMLKLSDPGEAAWEELAGRYSEEGRHYHTLVHVADCLGLLAEREHDTPVLRLALFYHDVIYDPCGEDNELESARFASGQLAGLGLADSLTAVIYDLIRATDHKPRPGLLLEHGELICDIDLAILGAPPGDYWDYASAIRREYGWLPDGKYRAGRIRVLEAFLKRPGIYQTPAFHPRFEQQARQNMAAEISALVSGVAFGTGGG